MNNKGNTMKKQFLSLAVILLAGVMHAVTISWNNRFSYESYNSNATWGNGKNTESAPLLSLNSSTTTGKVYEAPDGFTRTYETETSFASMGNRCLMTSIVLSSPNTTEWNATGLPYLVLKAADGTTYVSQAPTISSGKAFLAKTPGGTESNWDAMTFLFEEPVGFTLGQTYNVFFATDAEGKALYPSSNLDKRMLSSPSGEILFDVQLSYNPLPEPTVSALLALCLAGLALRRKGV